MLLALLLCLTVVCGIIYMKRMSSSEKVLLPSKAFDTVSQQVAVPDTTVVPGVLPVSSDSVVNSVVPDTVLGKDKRRPYEAGYEDGYAAGCDDGAAQSENATYDETSSFRSTKERNEYVEGYRDGYAKGFEDGKDGKQFNI